MLARLFSRTAYLLREVYENLKFKANQPDAPYPLVETDIPGLSEKLHDLRQQYALAKEARRILYEAQVAR